jgi:hypothetical protein
MFGPRHGATTPGLDIAQDPSFPEHRCGDKMEKIIFQFGVGVISGYRKSSLHAMWQ